MAPKLFKLLLAVFFVLFTSCGGSGGTIEEPDPVLVESVTVSTAELHLNVGQTATLTARIHPSNAEASLSWKSSDVKVATVSSDGLVTAAGEGSATITASAGGKSATCKVTVTREEVEVTGIALDKTEMTLSEGESVRLTATISPANATDKSVTWFSSNPAVVSVDNDGLVKAISAGSATVAASHGNYSAHCKFTVTAASVAVTSVTLDKTTVALSEQETVQLTATVLPADASDKTVTWSSSNPAVASVSGSGLVTAIAEGSAVITATAGSKSATCAVTVAKKVVAVTSVTLDRTSVALVERETVQLTATVLPADASDKTVTWSSSNLAVASVSGSGLVTAIAEGSAVITATAGGKSATCAVTVTKKVVAVTSVTLDRTSVALVERETVQLTATVLPADASDKTVTWSSSNLAVASVSGSGLVTAIAEGSAVITATAGGKPATCAVTVAKKVVAVTSVTLDKTSVVLSEQETVQLTATVLPADATDKTVTWSTSNPAIASVSGSGLVTAIAEGSAVITATAGGKSATCDVMVKREYIPVTSIMFDDDLFDIEIDKTLKLPYKITPANADEPLTWTSSSPSCVSVDQSGVVTGRSVGTVTITVKGADASATCKVTSSYYPTGITLNVSTLSLYTGDRFQMTGTVNKHPQDNSNYGINWYSSDPSVASISSEGLITAHTLGTVTITAKTWKDVSATCTVTVSKKIIAVTSVALNKTTLSLTEQDTFQLTATVSPADATDKTVTWSSSNTAVVTVSGDGLVTAVAPGSAIITAKAGDKTATCTVTVSKKIIPVTSVTLDHTTLELARGGAATLHATVLPADATNPTVTWTTSNRNIVTVDKNGNINAIKAGSATITATVGNLTASCLVTVVVPVTAITLNITSKALKENETVKLTATIKPTDATQTTVVWASDNPSVARVDNNGVVTAVSEGVAIITASVGDVTASCTITVSNTASGGHEGTGTEIWD